MTETQDSNHAVTPVSEEDVTAALLELTGDLDKAQVLQQKLPAWWKDADAATLQALQQAHEQGQRPREQAARLLGRVKPLKEFCAEKLKAFLVAKGHVALDVERAQLEIHRVTINLDGPTGLARYKLKIEKHSLLQAAMQNFSEDGAEMPEGSVVRAGNTVVHGLSAEAFAGYCRELDLGAAYQLHLRDVFNLPAPSEAALESDRGYNPAVLQLGNARRLEMLVDLHIAYAKGDVSQPTYTLLSELIKRDLPASQMAHLLFQGKPMVWRGLSVGGTCVWGVMVLANANEDGFPTGPVVLYMANEPTRRWYEYPSLEDFKQYLTLKLQVQAYRRFFTGYLAETERLEFFQQFDRSRTLARLEPIEEPGNLSRFFFNVCTGKLQLDAITLAVPTAQADDDARQKRLQSYLDAGLTLLNIAGFVVPTIGLLMMGEGIGQLLGEVFEGIDDWSHNEKTEALEHLVNVAESIAGMAAFASGVKAFGGVKRWVTRPEVFFDGMEAVKRPDGSAWLWRRRTTAYQHPPEVVSGTVANAMGVYKTNGHAYAKIEARVHAIAYDAAAKQWSAIHPLRSDAYRPPLKHNGTAGWQFEWERPQDWEEPAYIITRSNSFLGALTGERLREIATIADLSLPRLRYLAQENLPLPERFNDGVVRFMQEQKVRDLTWQLEHQAQLDLSTARTQMLALPHMPGWPRGRFFEVLDEEGNLLESYPDTAPFDYEDLSIHITEKQLERGEVIPTLLAALDSEETQALLGGVVEPGEAEVILKRRLLKSLERSHRQVYDQLYQDANDITHSDHGLLIHHYPGLPNRQAWKLVSNASSRQLVRLRETRRVPLLLAQRTRKALRLLEEDRALSGLYWPRYGTEATQRLALGLLGRAVDWPQTQALQLRRGSLNGEVIAQLGGQGATLHRTIVASADGFQAFDAQGKALGVLATGGEGFYQALTETLSADQIATLRLNGTQRASHLNQELLGKAETERKTLARYLWPERAVPEPAVACVQALLEELAPQPAALMRKLGKLYPKLSSRQLTLLLQDMGTDHLSRARAVKALQQQLKDLQLALAQWCDEKSAVKGLSRSAKRDLRDARKAVAKAIERSWKRKTLLRNERGIEMFGLELEGLNVGALPQLPAEVDFGHVRRLVLRNMDLDDQVGSFLERFKGVNLLDLAGNKLTQVPTVLSQMSLLKRLYLNRNQLQLTEAGRALLATLTELRVLNLNHNPLLNAPLIDRMFDLRALFLNSCSLKELPVGFRRPPYLETVDLRGNHITTLPRWLSEVPRVLAQTLHLGDNPLDTLSRQLVSAYRSRVGVGMGFLEDDPARLTEQRAQEHWLKDVGADIEMKRATWAALRAEEGSEGLFNLLAGLGSTADAKNVRMDMSQRVWWVLEAAEADADLRAEIFDRAATPLNCDDAAAASFSNLEVLTHLHEASKGVESGQLTAEPLLKLSKGLFRLDQVERYARSHSVSHPSADPLEVSLAFRIGLADTLDLPGQPRHMRYEQLAEVTNTDLVAAADKVRVAELSPELLDFIVGLPFWIDYLKRRFHGRFEDVLGSFHERAQQVFDQRQTLTDTDYVEQMNVITSERTPVEAAEIRRQTEDALKPGALNVC
ncbi:NEL-type E3 ubiquitin ligase domain-containing protein [Pseudomonas canadensis]|uniref:NEL-type E3 ubiquitin ligase domain-containing protein n=1 Tax=Pseudomonas canadensis TaxID=915099 RepID=UPI0030D58716